MAKKGKKVAVSTEVTWDGDDILAQLAKDVRRRLSTSAIQYQRAVKQELSKMGTGRKYLRTGAQDHVASLPGRPPAPDTGTLRRSAQVDSSRLRKFIISIGSNLSYASYLENPLGLNRPAWLPTLKRLRKRILANFKGLI